MNDKTKLILTTTTVLVKKTTTHVKMKLQLVNHNYKLLTSHSLCCHELHSLLHSCREICLSVLQLSIGVALNEEFPLV